MNELPDVVICNIANYADGTIFCCKFDKASDLWQQVELAFELEYYLRDTADFGMKWFVDFNAGKVNLFCFNNLITLVLWICWGSNCPIIAESISKKTGILIHSMSFFLLRLLFISINLLKRSCL